uniref:hypothetical protein n=1 Tax=Candidatus Electronema sp. TaxID=2698783 RepID=UPI004056A29D
MTTELETTIHALCDSLSQLWSLDLFKVDYLISPEWPKKAVTEAEETATRLPVTGRLIRGLPGVKFTFSQESDLEYSILNLLRCSNEAPKSYHHEQIQGSLTEVQRNISNFAKIILGHDRLIYRSLKESIGLKIGSFNDFIEWKASWENETTYPSWIYFSSIQKILTKQLITAGFNPNSRQDFSSWELVKEGTVNVLKELELLNEDFYEVRIFFNGPIVDLSEDVPLVDLSIANRDVRVFLGYAPDDLLTPLSNDGRPTSWRCEPVIGVEKINTVARYKVKISAEDNENSYTKEYYYASYAARLILDSLRLCRPIDDIGIIAIEIHPLSLFAPPIPKTYGYAFDYQPYMAPYIPKRFDFSPASAVPLNKEELESVSREILLRLPSDTPKNKKIEYAIKRFRNSIERYSPDDPERLIEYAIALETIYLNDNGTERTELTYRLRLRAARFLKENYEDRDKLFKLIGDLYSFRSTVAHGGDISISAEKDQEKLRNILKEIPSVLAESILKIMNEHYEEHNTKALLFWRKIELQ